MAFRGFVLMTSFLALRASVCIFCGVYFNYFARFGLDGTATWMEQLPGLDTAARMEQLPGWNNYLGSILPRLDLGNSLYQLSYVEHLLARMEQLPGWNNYLGSNLRPQTTRALTLPIELRGASTPLLIKVLARFLIRPLTRLAIRHMSYRIHMFV